MLGRAPELPLNSKATHSCRDWIGQRRSTPSRQRQVDVHASKAKRKYAKPASPKPAPASQDVTNTPAPPRIDNNSNVSIRKQQRLVKAKKAVEAAASKVPYKQAFRKSKLDPEQRAEEEKRQAEADQAAQKAFLKSPLASLRNLYGLKGNERPPALLVDGYNLLHKYVQHMQDSQPDSPIATTQNLEEMRTALEAAMITYSQRRSIKLVVVYDAMNRLPDPVYVDIRTSTRTTMPGQIDVVFCSDQTADSWIVKEVATIKQEGKVPHVMVATDDNEVTVGARSSGGYQIPCRYLIDEILTAEAEVKERSSAHVPLDWLMSTVRSKHYRLFEHGTACKSQLQANPSLQSLRQKMVEKNRLELEQAQAEASAKKDS